MGTIIHTVLSRGPAGDDHPEGSAAYGVVGDVAAEDDIRLTLDPDAVGALGDHDEVTVTVDFGDEDGTFQDSDHEEASVAFVAEQVDGGQVYSGALGAVSLPVDAPPVVAVTVLVGNRLTADAGDSAAEQAPPEGGDQATDAEPTGDEPADPATNAYGATPAAAEPEAPAEPKTENAYGAPVDAPEATDAEPEAEAPAEG